MYFPNINDLVPHHLARVRERGRSYAHVMREKTHEIAAPAHRRRGRQCRFSAGSVAYDLNIKGNSCVYVLCIRVFKCGVV